MRAKKFLDFIRWKDWALGKVPIYCTSCFYISLAYQKFSISYIEDFFMFIVFVSSLAIYGYLINDLGDRKLDKLHGKRNSFENLNSKTIALVFLAIMFLMILSGISFVHRDLFLLLWIIQVIISTFYSMPPIRFKERGFAGLIVAIVIQYPFVVLLLFAAFAEFGGWDMIILLICTTVSGAALEIGHQKFDFIRDSQTETDTFAVRKGYGFAAKIYRHVLQLDMLSMGAMIVLMAFKIPWINLPLVRFKMTPILPLAIVYLVLYFQIMRRIDLMPNKTWAIDPYYKGKKDIFNIMYVLLPNFVVPIYLAWLLTCYYYYNIIILLFFILWTYLCFPKLHSNFLWPIKAILNRKKD